MRMQALMSLLEGHASYVMNEVARDHVKDVDRMRRALSARRKASSLERIAAEGDRLRTEDQAVRHGRALRPDRRRSRGHVDVQPGLAELERPADARRDRRTGPLAREGGRLAGAMRRPPAVARVLERVTATAREHEMFLPGHSGPGRRVRRPRLGLPAGVARPAPPAPQDPPRGLPLRSSAARGVGERTPPTSARLAARHDLAVPSARGDRVAAGQGESIEAWAREQRHFAIAEVTRETGRRADRDRPHDGRPGRDGADRADHRERDPRGWAASRP